MATRSFQAQSFHDRVIEIAASYLDKSKYSVYTNPNGYKNTAVGGRYPDIILTGIGNNTVLFMIEVETEDSVTAAEAINQWIDYAKLGGTFYLLVPKALITNARILCVNHNVSAKFGWYWVENGMLQIQYE